MPEVSPKGPADRVKHARSGAHFRTDGTMINAPDDLLENAGAMVELGPDGNPVLPDGRTAFRLVGPEVADGWSPYVGTSPTGAGAPTKQTASPLPLERPSFALTRPPIAGDPAPSLLVAAPLPRPEAPLLIAEGVEVEGYPASSAERPYFHAYTWFNNPVHSALSPASLVPEVANGRSIRVPLSQAPEGVRGIGVWLTAPGSSTYEKPGTFYLQRVVDVSRFNPGFYDLEGTFRFDKTPQTSFDRVLATPGAPDVRLVPANKAVRRGWASVFVTFENEYGETGPGPYGPSIFVRDDPFYFPARHGRGVLRVTRPAYVPVGTKGWRAYSFVNGDLCALYDSRTQQGLERPFPMDRLFVDFSGFSSPKDNEYARKETVFLVPRERPGSTVVLEDPTEPPGEAVVFGSPRPPAGTYYAGVTESKRGRESVLSLLSSITITDEQTLRVVRMGSSNRIPNPFNTELGADGLPLDQTIVRTGGFVDVEDGDLVLRTDGPKTSTTPSSATRLVEVNVQADWTAGISFAAEAPSVGFFSGAVEAVLEEANAAGALTRTVLFSLPAAGGLDEARVIHRAGATGLAAGEIKWRSDTTEAGILVRFAGATKNATARVTSRSLNEGLAPPPVAASDPAGADLKELPEGFALPIYPAARPPSLEPADGPIPAVSPWPGPNRPTREETALEPKHDFEFSMPAGWSQVVTNATLTRETGPQLSGNGYLRSRKASTS